MGIAIESEKKYLVKLPKSWSDLAKLFDSLIDIKRITQTYLKPKNNEPSARVRKTIEGTDKKRVVFHFNQKKFIQTGVHEEKEHEISEKEYEKYLKNPHPDKVEIEKTRFVFKYKDQVFELDLFKDALKNLAILEIELKNIKQKVDLPPYLEIIKDVTKNKAFNNYELANKELHQ